MYIESSFIDEDGKIWTECKGLTYEEGLKLHNDIRLSEDQQSHDEYLDALETQLFESGFFEKTEQEPTDWAPLPHLEVAA